MIMKNFDFTHKELVETFNFTTITTNRKRYSDVIIYGRKYRKFGVIQSVTAIGNLFEDCNGNNILMIGISKQHPCDSKCDKDMAYSAAQEKAFANPDIVMYNVPKYFSNYNFRKMMKWYIDAMDLDFIKTRTEIEKSGLNPQNYYR